MNRVVALSMTMVVVAAMMGGVGAVSAATADSEASTPGPLLAEEETTSNESNVTTSEPATENGSEDDISAGARLAGVIGAQQAEHSATFETKTFEKAFQGAASNESKAAVVARSKDRIQDRIQILENETVALEAAYQNGTISNGTYHGKMTSLTARIQALEHQANQTSVRGRSLPAAALEARGLNQHDLTALENRTHNATSPHAAAIAKRVAGPNTGQPTGPPETVPGHADGPPGHGNGPQSGDTQGDTPGQASGQNGSANGSGPSNTTNGAPGNSATNSSTSSGNNPQSHSNSGANNGSSAHLGWAAGNSTNGPDGQNASQAGSNERDHPVFGNSAMFEFLLGFFG